MDALTSSSSGTLCLVEWSVGKTVCCLTYHAGLSGAYLLYCFVKLWPLALATILLWSEAIYFIWEFVAQFCFAYWLLNAV